MIICADRIVTGDGHAVYHGYGVRVDEQGRIAEVEEGKSLLRRYPKEPVVSYEKSTLLPGFVDLHAHLGHYTPAPRAYHNDFMLAYVAQHHAHNAFRRGVTTLRDVATPDHLTQTMQAAAELGYMELPRIYPCDRGICMTGGHGTQQGAGEGVEEVDGPWALRSAVRRRVKAGCRWIKVMTSHRSDMPEFTQEELDTIAEEAHRLGAKVVAHAGTQPAIQMCIDAGIDSIEHGTFLTEAQALEMKEKGITWTPTILPYLDYYQRFQAQADDPKAPDSIRYFRRAADAYRNEFMKLVRTGVRFGAGTDYIDEKGESDPWLARELAYMVECGLEPLAAIQAGTSSGAAILGLENVTGTIRVGLEADLVLVAGDPVTDIRDLDHIQIVWKSGKAVYQV